MKLPPFRESVNGANGELLVPSLPSLSYSLPHLHGSIVTCRGEEAPIG